MTAPTVAHALRLAEGIETTPENYRTIRELITELRALAVDTAGQVALYATAQARLGQP